MFVASRLSKAFGSGVALQDVSVTLEPGELTVVLGPSGSGKTTLLRCISLLEMPDTGSLEMDGVCFAGCKAPADRGLLYPRLGVVFQGLSLWPHLTLRDNILLPLKLRESRVDYSYVDQLIDTFGMGGFVERLPREVSGGERQRAAIVRALALRPAYLLLDEITSALDIEQVVVVLNELERLKRDGAGILLITHLMGFARRAAENFIFLDKGRIVERGPVAQLDDPQSNRLSKFLQHIGTAG